MPLNNPFPTCNSIYFVSKLKLISVQYINYPEKSVKATNRQWGQNFYSTRRCISEGKKFELNQNILFYIFTLVNNFTNAPMKTKWLS